MEATDAYGLTIPPVFAVWGSWSCSPIIQKKILIWLTNKSVKITSKGIYFSKDIEINFSQSFLVAPFLKKKLWANFLLSHYFF